jgi:hypothetical protein
MSPDAILLSGPGSTAEIATDIYGYRAATSRRALLYRTALLDTSR